MLKKIIKNNRGISYPELLAVISIIAILSSVALANATSSGHAGQVYIAGQKLTTHIRQAQNYALSAQEFGTPAAVPKGGWGIYFNKNRDTYSVYADLGELEGVANGDHTCLDDCSVISAEKYNDISLPDNIKIDKIELIRSGDGAIIPVDEVHITFEPPDPITHICLGVDDCGYDQVEIFLINQYLDKRKAVVNFFGLIETQKAAY